MKKVNIGVLGLGEVGKAIKFLAKKKGHAVFCRDVNSDEIKNNKIDILHICIPYTDSFSKIVINTIKQINPQFVIIDSTVKPGTTRTIYQATKTMIVHAPIMGVHPNLAKYQSIFTKVIGPIDKKSFLIAKKHWLNLGAHNVIEFESAETSEMAKILSTCYYGWNIAFNKEVKKISDMMNLNFEQVYTQFNHIYNQGYEEYLPNVRRPVLNYVQGEIGGHCVVPNANILSSYVPNILSKIIKEASY